jgi:hypothetical protein
VFRWIIAIVVSSVLLFGAQSEEETMSPMEMLLFKIGFTALVEEFEEEKNTTQSNSERIAALEKNLELLVKFMEMTRGELLKDRDIRVKPGSSYGIYNTEAMKKELSVILETYKKEIDHSRETELKRLRSEVAALKRDIRSLVQNRAQTPVVQVEPAKNTERKTASRTGKYRVVVDEMNIRHERSASSPSVGKLKRDDRVEFGSCDRYGWCTLAGREGYVPKHLFLPVD